MGAREGGTHGVTREGSVPNIPRHSRIGTTPAGWGSPYARGFRVKDGCTLPFWTLFVVNWTVIIHFPQEIVQFLILDHPLKRVRIGLKRAKMRLVNGSI